MLTWLSDLPAPAIQVTAALVVFAESGFLVGVLLPTGGLLVLLGTLVNAGTLALVPTVLLVALASIAGGCLGYRRASIGARVRSRPSGRVGHLVAQRSGRATDRAARWLRRHPAIGAAAGQCIVGTRTIVPRVAGAAGIPSARLLLGSVPAAVLWAAVLVGGGTISSSVVSHLTLALAMIGHAVLGPPLVVAAATATALLAVRLTPAATARPGDPQ